MRKLYISAFFIFALTSNFAFADGYLRLGGLYLKDSSGSEDAPGDITRTMIEIGGGYIQPKGWTIGALYSTDKYSSGGGSLDRTAMGPTVGWMTMKDNGPYVLATYFMSASRSDNLTGSGYQLDLGYKFAVRKVSFGGQLSKKSITFDKANGASFSPKYVEDKIDPSFVILVAF